MVAGGPFLASRRLGCRLLRSKAPAARWALSSTFHRGFSDAKVKVTAGRGVGIDINIQSSAHDDFYDDDEEALESFSLTDKVNTMKSLQQEIVKKQSVLESAHKEYNDCVRALEGVKDEIAKHDAGKPKLRMVEQSKGGIRWNDLSRSRTSETPWTRASIARPNMRSGSMDPEAMLQAELLKFIMMRPYPVTLADILEMTDPDRIAKYVHQEVPVRYAERIRWIEEIQGWEEIEELRDVRELQRDSFQSLRFARRRDLVAFTELVEDILVSEENIPHTITRGMYRLSQDRSAEWMPQTIDPWLDKFFLNSIGTDMLLNQYLACYEANVEESEDSGWFEGGMVDPECDPAKICRQVADDVIALTEEMTGKAPIVRVEVHAPWEKENANPSFSFIPGFLRYITTEILKNSCKATAELCTNYEELVRRPINIVIAADTKHVAISIRDKARGVPFEHRPHVFSYLYSTAKHTHAEDGQATDLAGYGVGLPLSRLYAAYLGGSMDLVSLPGYGTSVDLFFSRITAELREVVPHSLAEGQQDDRGFVPPSPASAFLARRPSARQSAGQPATAPATRRPPSAAAARPGGSWVAPGCARKKAFAGDEEGSWGAPDNV